MASIEKQGGFNFLGTVVVAAAVACAVITATHKPAPLTPDYGGKIADLSEKFGSLEVKVANTETRVDQVGTTVIATKNELADQIVGAKSHAVDKAKEAADALNAKLAKAEELRALEVNVGEHGETIGRIQPALERASSTATTAATTAESAMEKAERSTEQISEMQKELDALRAELAAARDEMKAAIKPALEKPAAAPPAEPAERSDRVIFVHAPWCTWCKGVEGYRKDVEAAGITWGDTPDKGIESVDLTSEKGKRYARKYRLPETFGLPAFIRVVDGKFVLMTNGLIGAKNLIEFARRAVKKNVA